MFYRFLYFFSIIISYLNSLYALNDQVLEESSVETIEAPLGLPKVPWPKDNPYSKEKDELGRLLYFDKRLSSDQTISCASCHNAPCAYSDCRAIAIGIKNTKGTRHSPTIINAAYSKLLFWDGRADSLEDQCRGPIGNPKEMTNTKNVHEAHQQCVNRLKMIPGYLALFKEAFGQDEITIDEIAKAVATFERTILSGNSAYDRYRAGDRTALSQEQIHGMDVFKKSGCANCHGGFNFSDERFFNIGIGMNVENPDLGRYVITHQDRDWGAFKVPTLRESANSGPYMHDGSLETLEAVIDYYDRGGNKNKNLHPLMRPLNLSPEDKKALISFLQALNGEGWQTFKEPKEFPQ